jgi:hypothetical protein
MYLSDLLQQGSVYHIHSINVTYSKIGVLQYLKVIPSHEISRTFQNNTIKKPENLNIPVIKAIIIR